jgi:hypothetical protein
MRTLNLVCAGLALIGFIVSAMLWRELRVQRDLMAYWLRTHPEAASAFVAAPASSTASATHTAEAAAAERRPFISLPTPGINEQIPSDRALLRNPEYRKTMLAPLRLAIPHGYPGLVEELRLSTEEADRLFDVLAEHQLELNGLPLPAFNNGMPPDPTTARELAQARRDLQDRQDESLVSILGETRHGQWKEYLETRGVRQQVIRFAEEMKSLGEPLSEAEERSLHSALAAEEKRRQQEVQGMLSNAGQSAPPYQGHVVEETNRRHEESVERILAAAQPHLSTRQLESLRTSLGQQPFGSRAPR